MSHFIFSALHVLIVSFTEVCIKMDSTADSKPFDTVCNNWMARQSEALLKVKVNAGEKDIKISPEVTFAIIMSLSSTRLCEQSIMFIAYKFLILCYCMVGLTE